MPRSNSLLSSKQKRSWCRILIAGWKLDGFTQTFHIRITLCGEGPGLKIHDID